MKTKILSRLILLLILFTSGIGKAQIFGTDAYIKGDYVEVGVSANGAFGASVAPTGYHPRPSPVGGVSLGFVSDPDKDGWLVSSPGRAAYMGDYFVPGSPYEGWELKAGTLRFRYSNLGAPCPGTTCANISYTASATEQVTVWQGTAAGLEITQKTVVKKDKVYFVIFVDIVNTTGTPINNIYYFRGLDPDNDQPWPGGAFNTDNKIIFQPTALSKNCLVTAEGRGYPTQAYLGLGTKDCRAKACIFDNWYSMTGGGPVPPPDDIYNQAGAASTGFYYTTGTVKLNQDIAIGLVYNLGNLDAGQKTSLAYTYILKQADLDSALGETAPKFESGGTPYSPYTTFRVCPGKTIPLKVINGGQYKWIWTTTSFPHYMTASGASTLVPVGGTIATITGTKVYPFGAVYGDSIEVAVFGPKTYTATGISTCDTQVLIFYVDTISFSIPPSVVSPVRYCEGETPVALTAGLAAGATANWYTVATGGVAGSTAPIPSTLFPIGSTKDFDTTSYWVSQTNLAGCETPRAKIDVIITKRPAMPIVENLVYCKGSKAQQLTALGENLKWYDAATGGTRFTVAPTPFTTTVGSMSYYVSQTINGCESDRAKIDVEVSEVVASFNVSKDSLCGDEALFLTNISSSSSAGSYVSTWSFGDGVSSNDSNTTHRYLDKRGQYKVQLLVTNVHGCQDSFTRSIEVFPIPSMSISANKTKICQGEAVDFESKVTEGYRALSWDFGDGDPSFNLTVVRHSFKQAGTFPIKITGEYPACPATGSGITVDVVALPKVNLGNDTGFCAGNAALSLGNKHLSSVEKYLWNTGDTSATILVRNAGQYSLSAYNWVCRSSDTIAVAKSCYLDIPNAFSPGSDDEYNKYFLPRNLLSKAIVTFNMKIFDRWGQQLFESERLDGMGWDGNYKGAPMPMGVYVYIIQVSFANGISESYNGSLTLLR